METTKFNFDIYADIPDQPGYCRHERYATYDEIYTALTAHLKAIPHADGAIYDLIDYISMKPGHKETSKEIPEFRTIYCYMLKGGSEGYYFHVDLCTNDLPAHSDKYTCIDLVLCKSLTEKLETALLINTEINRFVLKGLQ